MTDKNTATCPHCEATIDHLEFDGTAEVSGTCLLDAEHIEDSDTGCLDIETTSCPKCGEALDSSELIAPAGVSYCKHRRKTYTPYTDGTTLERCADCMAPLRLHEKGKRPAGVVVG